MTRTRYSLLNATALAALMAFLPGLLNAADGDAEPYALEEVIVTAQKRQENLQEIPVAVTAISADDLEQKQLRNMQDIRTLVPNLYLEEALSGGSTVKMSLRGIGVDNQNFSFDAPIGIYIDGVYYARSTGALVDLFDVQRIEVLRGPQGTLYGRNSSVGALRIVSNVAPLDSVEAIADVTIGSKNQRNARFAVGAPLVEDKLGVRFAMSTRNNDGWQTNVDTGERAKDDAVNAGRLQLRYVPNDDLEITLRGDYMTDRGKGTAGSNFLNNPDGDIYTFESSIARRSDIDSWGSSATLNWTGPSFNVTAVSAYRNLEYRNAEDVDGLAAVRSFEVARQNLDQWQFTQELFASGENVGATGFDWVAGLFYFRENNEMDWAVQIFAPPSIQSFEQDTTSVAAYGQAIFPVSERLNLTAGIRYTDENKEFSASQILGDGTPNPAFDFADDIGASEFTWRLAADYAASDNVLFYANAATGFRSGGFNGNALSREAIVSQGFGVEKSFAAETGFKSELLDNKLRLNVGYFYSEYDDLQQAITLNDGSVSTTSSEATVHGLEAELKALPFDGFVLGLTVGSMFDDIKNSSLELKNTPRWQFRVDGAYTVPVPSFGGSLRFAADISYRTNSFNTTSNVVFTDTGKYETVNANIGYETDDKRWAFTLAGHNLTDQFVNIFTFNIAGGFISSVHYPNTPRRWAFTVRYRY